MDIKDIKELISEVSKSGISDFTYEENGVKLSLSKASDVQIIQEEVKSRETDEITFTNNVEEKIVKSPLVGTVYVAPAEGEAPFVSVGDKVKKGQILAIMEAMKLMNEIESEYEGVVKEICVENESMVEFGQPLFVIE